MPTLELLLATNNPGKVKEYTELFTGAGFYLVTPKDKGMEIDPVETGQTFAENAVIKAEVLSAASGLLTLADDSGLEVDALGGAPGVRSARYAGDGATDADRNALLLENMKDISEPQRTARFRCAIAIAGSGHRTQVVEGVVEGIITDKPRGSGGFGYDPVFYLPELGCTMAELTPEEKNGLSHRARAAVKARVILREIHPSV
ncbi:MAG: XTP/dITP diphosphatase [Dehalogenimonas sp.]